MNPRTRREPRGIALPTVARPRLPGAAHPSRPRLAQRPERPLPDRRDVPRLLPVQPARAGARQRALGSRQLDRPVALDRAPGRPDARGRPASTRRAAGAAVSSTTAAYRPRSTPPTPTTPGTRPSASPGAIGRWSTGPRPRRRVVAHAGRPGHRGGARPVRVRLRRPALRRAGRGQRGGRPPAAAVDCDDLEHWVELDPLLTTDDPVAAEVAAANIWECPNLAYIDGRWVLLLSVWRWVDGTHRLDGVRYLVGDLVSEGDGLRFKATSGGRGRRRAGVLRAPAAGRRRTARCSGAGPGSSDRDFAAVAQAGWAGSLTFPRELFVRDGRLGTPAGRRADRAAPGAAGPDEPTRSWSPPPSRWSPPGR